MPGMHQRRKAGHELPVAGSQGAAPVGAGSLKREPAAPSSPFKKLVKLLIALAIGYYVVYLQFLKKSQGAEK